MMAKRRGNPNWIKKKKEREAMEEEAAKEAQESKTEEAPKTRSREDERLEAARARRAAREDPGKMRRKLSAPSRKGYHRHWINDHKGKVQIALENGYMFVEQEAGMMAGDPDAANETTGSLDSRMSRPVGTKEDGSALIAYLMEIPDEWREQDRRQMYNQIDEIEKGITQGADQYGQPGRAGRYIPDGGTTIERGG